MRLKEPQLPTAWLADELESALVFSRRYSPVFHGPYLYAQRCCPSPVDDEVSRPVQGLVMRLSPLLSSSAVGVSGIVLQ